MKYSAGRTRIVRWVSVMLAVIMACSTLFPVSTQAAVSLSASVKTMYVGDRITLKLTGTTKKVSWSSSNASVAAVDKNGKVTAKAAGKATITAKYGSSKKTCAITVKKLDEELARAKSLGIVSSISSDKYITSKSFFNMIDKVVKKTSKKKLSAFQKQYKAARSSSKKLSRYDGMVIVLAAAETLGADELNYSDWMNLHQKIGESCWDSIHWDGSLFGNNGGKPSMHWTREASAYFYSFGRLSKYNGKSIFDYDAKSNSMRPADRMTYAEAVKAAVRLYDSIDSNYPIGKRNKNAPEDKALLSDMEANKAAILSSATDVSYTGTAYYVSNNGNDANDGLTPETAWQTLERAQGLSAGDAVFFERGGLWRGDLMAEPGVTYSAYGKGEKPRIYGSPENGANASKWKLWYNKNGVKIWKYHTKLHDPGGIVFNEGKSYASRVYSVWKNKEARVWNNLNKKFNIANELKYDLQFYCGYPDNMSKNKLPLDANNAKLSGDIYLRCDKGNPGTLYNSIEFQTKREDLCTGYSGIVFCIGDGCVIDNLCLKYSHTMGISSSSNDNIRVQNCEVAFVGGTSHIIGYDYVPVAGEGIRLDGRHCQATHNYVHDCFDGGILFEPDLASDFFDITAAEADRIWGDLLIENNVIERCMSGVLIGVHCEDKVTPKIADITIKNNDILYSGYGWSGDPHCDFTWKSGDYNGNAITFWDDDYPHGKITVSGNRLYVARASLIHMGYAKGNTPAFNGNTYAQNKNGYVLYSSLGNCSAISDTKLKEFCRKNIGDKNAVCLSVY